MFIAKKYIEFYKRLPVQVKASVWFLISSILQKSISVISTPIFTRILTVEEYGKFNEFYSWMSVIGIFVTLNLSYGVYMQGLVKFSDERKLYTSSMHGLTLVLVSLWSVIYGMFHPFINKILNLNTVQVTCMIFLIWFGAIFNFWAVNQRVRYRYKLLVVLTLIISVLEPILSIIMIHFLTNGVTARILGMVIVEFLGYMGLFIYQVRQGKKLYNKKIWLYALGYNIPLIPHYLSQTALNSADRIMIGIYINSASVAIYSLAYSLGSLTTFLSNALSQTITPWFFQKLKDNSTKEIGNVGYSSLILIGLVNLILVGLAPEIVRIFAPPEYIGAIWCIPPISVGIYFMYSYDLYSRVAFYYEKTKLISVATAVGAVLNIVLNVIFIKKLGYIAAAYNTMICYIVYSVFHFKLMNKICHDEKIEKLYDVKIIVGISLAVSFSCLAFLLVYKLFFIRLLLLMLLLVVGVYYILSNKQFKSFLIELRERK